MRGTVIKSWLDTVTTLAMLCAAAILAWKALSPLNPRGRPAEMAVPTALLPIADAPSLGNAAANVVLIEFSDFQCPYCDRFTEDAFVDLKKEYIDTGRVRMIFRHFPLDIHKRANRAAETAECAARQGLFWQMHDQLFGTFGALEEGDLLGYAKTIGAQGADFDSCMRGGATERVSHDVAIGKQIGVTGTPTFVIGVKQSGQVKATNVLRGAQKKAPFASVLDALLARYELGRS